MKKPSIVLTALATLSLSTLAGNAHAQEVTRLPETSRQSIGLDAGIENAFIARVAYTHRVDLGVLEDTRLYGRFTMPFATPDLGDWGVDGGMRATLVRWNDLRVALLAGPVVKSSSNELYSATALGLNATMLVGYEGQRWGLSADLGYEQFFSTHIRHSDMYRQVGYAGAKDGWYALSGSTAHGGLRGGARIGSVEVFARAGFAATGELHALALPYYATLGTAYAF